MKKLIPLLLCCLLLAGCINPNVPLETTPTESEPLGVTEIATDPATDPETEPPVTVTIYYGNDNADGFETAEVQVEEIDMNVLVEQLIAHGVLPENVHIGSMQFEGTCLNLNFSASFGDYVCTMGTAGEYIVMGSVVNTFLTAWPEAETVFITANSETIETGHNIYDFEMEFFD